MTPRVTPEHVEARREEILGAAFRCFARSGIHATTMQEIAAEAGLSAGAIYGYFEGKEGLVQALAEAAAARRADALAGLEPGGGANALAEIVTGMMADLDVEGAEVSVRLDVRLWAEALDRPGIRATALEAFASVRDPVAAYVRSEREAGRIREGVDPDAVGDLVVSLLTGLELQRALGEIDLDAYRSAAREALGGLAP